MPKGVRKELSLEVQIQRLGEQIAVLEKHRQELQEKKRQEDLRSIQEFMDANQLSAAQILEMLSNSVAASASSEDLHV